MRTGTLQLEVSIVQEPVYNDDALASKERHGAQAELLAACAASKGLFFSLRETEVVAQHGHRGRRSQDRRLLHRGYHGHCSLAVLMHHEEARRSVLPVRTFALLSRRAAPLHTPLHAITTLHPIIRNNAAIVHSAAAIIYSTAAIMHASLVFVHSASRLLHAKHAEKLAKLHVLKHTPPGQRPAGQCPTDRCGNTPFIRA
mmetsp:Transcript_72740/g.144520  ORF Transcript_72740/g.144520 Transcript_72740/m.144520 type:complete len:200 (-) Transcript_72740:526-1125(-)|eukprot:CAMPEP_0174705434 /NCGR_PEP_ID=MMETSP1094-20130205/8664_1 /TAXON_ID=156173 /ORGANISM="Chrysochromulina brevifilum, Strain UTEX LB 985" /LENGTH=199 /DNA_ID=CAMNT_0015903599 /DNA_START=150 /DNA_END=749 /DNA_ORIENTATION=+